MQKYQNNVVNQIGVPYAGALITVTLTATGALASVYSDNGVTAKANPFSTDSNGNVAHQIAHHVTV